MSVANLEAYALSKGITKSYSYNAMSQAEQVPLPFDKWSLESLVLTAIDIFSNSLLLLARALNRISSWISKNKTLLKDAVVVIGASATAWVTISLPSIIINIAVALGMFTAKIGAMIVGSGLAATVLSGLAAAIGFLTSPIGIVTLAIGSIIAAIALLIKHWSDVKEVAINAWEAIKKAWKATGEWFEDHVTSPLGSAFEATFGMVKNAINGGVVTANGFGGQDAEVIVRGGMVTVLGPSGEIIATGGSVTTDPDYYPRALWLLPDERDSGDFPF